MEIKINNIQIHKIHSRVVEAKLVLIECKKEKALFYGFLDGAMYLNHANLIEGLGSYYEPILISEIEKIEKDDWFYRIESPGAVLTQATQILLNLITHALDARKILALPEHFSPHQLQMIVDGKLKDEVLVECEFIYHNEGKSDMWTDGDYKIKFNSHNHITIHKTEEKLYTKDEVRGIFTLFQKWLNERPNQRDYWIDTPLINEWFEQNVKES